ncbi:MAG: CRISPR-associated endonuclease Cas3'' [Telmatospirillum sp.]|nr:CRISPR-associated endonuclease Cas3'' [Telmatospirillum sp.]
MYYAHSFGDDDDRSRWQILSEHLRGAEDLAAAFARPFGVEKAARLAALLHDLGKYTAEFQARLAGSPLRVDHAISGAAMARELARDLPRGWDTIMAELISYAIAGHHAGLPDWRDLADRLKDDRLTVDPVWRDELSVDPGGLKPPLTPVPARAAFQLGFLGRMIFSCVVDADFKDTEQFYDTATGTASDRDWPQLPDIIDSLIARFDRHMAGMRADSPVNRLRADILAEVRRNALMAPGLFTLTVPTGGGKTLASLGFALDHARRLGLSRIIYAIPFTSVIDQTAAIFCDVLGKDVILEHHSAIEEERISDRQQREKLRLAMEDWAAPIVITTNVQLFESLFANRPSRCRKLHNLANSVIILDEAQTLPLPLLKPCVAAIDELARNYGVSVVLCTATQPALDAGHFDPGDAMGLELAGRELAPDPRMLATQLRRVTLRDGGPLDDGALVAALDGHPQALVIVNSRKHALDLYRSAGRAGLEGLVHLSTRHYAAQRRAILDDVRQRLKNGRPCRLIATSLVEAGVDLDFPRVWRAEAGLDQIAQAAGRCNREGRRPVEDSIVTTFAAPDNRPPREVALLAEAYARMAARHDDHLGPAALEHYFREVYWAKGAALDQHGILGRFALDRGGLACDYRTVAGDFQMIGSGLVPVIVARDEGARQALDLLGVETVHAGTVARKLQAFVVQVPPKARALLRANGHVSFEREDRFGDQFAVLRTGSLYRDDVGLLWEEADYLGLEQSIF